MKKPFISRIIIADTNRLLIRDIVHGKQGKVVEKFLEVARLYEEHSVAKIRVLTDVSADRFWTVVSEIEVDSLEEYHALEHDGEVSARVGEIMEGYHDYVDSGRREIYAIEG